ncbi:hypothetical protein ACWD26_29050 [Streptomyces sp. NPDC002787]
MPSEEDWRSEEESEEVEFEEEDFEEESEEVESEEEDSEEVEPEDVAVLLPVSPFVLDDVDVVPLPLAVVSASACIVPISANMPAAAASVTAAAVAAVRRAPLRIPATAPRSLLSLVSMTVPLRSDVLLRPTVGERSERNL